MRQPFLQHMSNDDFVASYLGYDCVDELHKLWFHPMCTVIFLKLQSRFADLLRTELFMGLLYIRQLIDCELFGKKVSAFCENVESLEAMGEAGAMASSLVLGVLSSNGYMVRANAILDHQMLTIGCGTYREDFIKHLTDKQGIRGVKQLPYFAARPATPTFMEDKEDLEGAVRLVALVESMRHVSRPTVWKAKFP